MEIIIQTPNRQSSIEKKANKTLSIQTSTVMYVIAPNDSKV